MTPRKANPKPRIAPWTLRGPMYPADAVPNPPELAQAQADLDAHELTRPAHLMFTLRNPDQQRYWQQWCDVHARLRELRDRARSREAARAQTVYLREKELA